MATRIPNIQIELYGSTTLAWIDVSSALRMESGVSIKRGRGTRFDACGPSSCSFILDNNTGNFTPDNSSGAYWGQGNWAEKNQPVRVTIDSVQVFRGFVDSFTAYVTGGGECLCSVSASDLSKFLARNPLGSYGVERAKQIVDPSGVVYPLASSIGADTTAEYAAWRDPAAGMLTISTPGLGAWEFVSDAPPFGSGSFRGTKDIDTGNGVGLRVPKTLDISTGGSAFGAFRLNPAATGFHPLFFVAGSSSAYNAYLYVEPSVGTANLSLLSYPSGTVYTITSSVTKLNDDAWHTFALVFASTGKLATLYVDGASVGSVSSATVWALSPSSRANTFGSTNSGSSAMDGYLSTIGVTSEVLTAAKVSDLHDAVMTGDKGDTIATRCTNLMDFLYPSGSPTVAVSDVSGLALSGQDTNGRSLFDALNEIADSERGVAYVDRLGDAKFRGSSARTGASTVTLDALADLDGSVDTTLIDDDSLFANRIVASGPAGSLTVQNAASIARFGIVSESWTCIATSLSTPATARLNSRLDNTPRIGEVTIDLMTKSTVSTSTCLGLVPLDKVTITNLPSQLGASSRQAVIEGYTITASESAYSMSLDLSPIG